MPKLMIKASPICTRDWLSCGYTFGGRKDRNSAGGTRQSPPMNHFSLGGAGLRAVLMGNNFTTVELARNLLVAPCFQFRIFQNI